MDSDFEYCPKCKSKQALNIEKCNSCGYYLGAPNVRLVSKQEEFEALNKKYIEVIKNATSCNINKEIELFENNIKNNSRAVINVDIDYLKIILTNDKTLYANYQMGVFAHTRKPAEDCNDRQRGTADNILFGWFGNQITYAALSSNKIGLINYGNYTLILKEISVSERATLIEDNSYKFIEKYSLLRNPTIPLGVRSIWKDRHKLVLIKHIKNIVQGQTVEDFDRMILINGTERSKDQFIEVHIFGTFDYNAIEEITENNMDKDFEEQIIVGNLKSRCYSHKIQWNLI